MKHPSTTFLIIVALAGVAGGTYFSITNQFETPVSEPPCPPITSPYSKTFSCEGMVESKGGYVELLPPREDLIAEVFVKEGQFVKKGDPIYRMCTVELVDELFVLKQNLAVAQDEYDYLKEQPRITDVNPLESELRAQLYELERLKLANDRASQLLLSNTVSRADYDEAYNKMLMQKFLVEKAEKNLEQLKAGPSKYQIASAVANVSLVRAKIKQQETKIADSTVRTPFDGIVLQLNGKVGEYISLSDLSFASADTIPVIFGSSKLCVRVDINETDEWRVFQGIEGVAFKQGNADFKFPLRFSRISPLVVPKKNRTGLGAERVDDRVMQIIFDIDTDSRNNIYPGQQLEVFLDLDSKK